MRVIVDADIVQFNIWESQSRGFASTDAIPIDQSVMQHCGGADEMC
jgi:hypothetical protein